MEGAPLARAGVEDVHPNALARPDRDRVGLVLVGVAVEGDDVGLLGRHLGCVGALARRAEVVLGLRHPQLLVDRRQALGLDDHHPGHPVGGVREDRLGGAVVHEHAGVLGDEADRQPLAGRDVGVVAARRDLGGVEVDRVRHGHAHRLRAAVDEGDLHAVALLDDDRRRGGGPAVLAAVDHVGPRLGGREVRGDLGDVLHDVDGEPLDGARRHGGERRVDGVELLELDALRVGERGRGLVGRGDGHRGRRGADGRCRRRAAVVADEQRGEGDDGAEHGDERGQPEAHHHPLAPDLCTVVGPGRLGEALSGVVLGRQERRVDGAGGRSLLFGDRGGHGSFLRVSRYSEDRRTPTRGLRGGLRDLLRETRSAQAAAPVGASWAS